MILNKKYTIIYYSFLYLSLLIGFYFGEDFAGGFEGDHKLHNQLINWIFNESILYGLLNYDNYDVPHSPLFIIYIISLKKIFLYDEIIRLINLHFILLIPFFFYLSLKLKFKIKNDDLRTLIPSIFFFSPYFRSGSFWMDDNMFAISFISISIYFFIRYEEQNKNLKNILLSALFLAFASYFRPIYSIFSLYFFLKFFIDLRFNYKMWIYILFNLILSLPAFYYIFVLDINRWATNHLFRENIITVISLVSSLIFFYFLPILLNKDKLLLKKILSFKGSIIFLLSLSLLLLFFEYEKPYSGGIFLKASNLLFDNNYLFFLITSLGVVTLYTIFFTGNKIYIFDIILLFILFLFEMDGVIYHETYDPLLYILIFLLFKNIFFINYINKFNKNNFFILILFLSIFYFFAVFKDFILFS